jgi:3-oxoacyl-[acyl-carrier-protein] synthase-3
MRLLATATSLPPTTESAEEIAKAIGKSHAWVRERAGVVRRYKATRETASQLGAQAAVQALRNAGIEAAELGWILCGSATSDQAIPGNAALLQTEIGKSARGVPCLDVGMTCLGFLAGLHVAEQFFRGGLRKPILLVCSDIASVGTHPKRLQEYCLFGDGAAAVVLSPDGPPLQADFQTFGQFSELCELPAGGSRKHPSRGSKPDDFLFHMDGPKLFRAVVDRFPQFLSHFLAEHETRVEDIDWLVPHQASRHAIDSLSNTVGFGADRRIDIFATHGNQVSASIPTALHIGIESGRILSGQKILLAGTSAGVSFGAALLEHT